MGDNKGRLHVVIDIARPLSAGAALKCRARLTKCSILHQHGLPGTRLADACFTLSATSLSSLNKSDVALWTTQHPETSSCGYQAMHNVLIDKRWRCRSDLSEGGVLRETSRVKQAWASSLEPEVPSFVSAIAQSASLCKSLS